MSKDEIKINCLTDFQRAGVMLVTGGEYSVFLEHGLKLLKKLGDKKLIREYVRIKTMMKKGIDKKRAADKILTLGVLAMGL